MSRRFAFLAALLLLPLATAAMAGPDEPVSWQLDLGYSMVQGML